MNGHVLIFLVLTFSVVANGCFLAYVEKRRSLSRLCDLAYIRGTRKTRRCKDEKEWKAHSFGIFKKTIESIRISDFLRDRFTQILCNGWRDFSFSAHLSSKDNRVRNLYHLIYRCIIRLVHTDLDQHIHQFFVL
jgi:hypothetical protein